MEIEFLTACHWPALTSLHLHDNVIRTNDLEQVLIAHKDTLRTLALGVVGLHFGNWEKISETLKRELIHLESIYLLCVDEDALNGWRVFSDTCRRTEYEKAILGGKENAWNESKQMPDHSLTRI